MREGLLDLVEARRGHFSFESGHHGELWLDLDRLFARPARVAPFVDLLAELVAAYRVDAVCGPLTGGGFVAYEVAARLDAGFCYAERTVAPPPGELYAATYRLGGAPDVVGQRVAVLDDVVNAGSAVRSTLDALRGAGAAPVAFGALLVLGGAADELAAEQQLALAAVARLDHTLWEPAACPQCAAGVPLEPA